MSVFVQIGAGAGDKDARVNFRDGFTEYIKSLHKSTISRILLIEPNPLNIPYLIDCWKEYPQAEIYNIGIKPIVHQTNGAFFYYAEEDAPNYQTTSVFPNHIKAHFGDQVVLKKIFVGCLNINEFNSLFLAGESIIDLFCLDIEGLDAEILLDFDFGLINCEKISFESLSLGGQEKNVLKKLKENNYVFDGKGIDIHGYDWMFIKKRD